MAGLTSSWLRLGARKILSPISFKMRKWVSPISRCLAPSLCLALRRLPRASSAVGRDNSSRRGRRAQGPAEARPRDPAPSAAPTSVDARRRVLLGRHSNTTGGGRGERGPLRRGLDARARRTRPARDLSSRRSPCEAFLVELGSTAHGVERPARRRAGACRRSRSQRLEPAFLTRRSASRLHVPTSGCGCASCACALSCGANHGTVARACWGRRATGASPTSHGACLPRSGGGALRHPLALGRHDAAAPGRSSRGARACSWPKLKGRYTCRSARHGDLGGVLVSILG